MTSRSPHEFHHIKRGGSFFRSLVNLIVTLCVIGCLTGATAMAQTSGLGAITGTITDPAGAVVVGAQLRVTNVATGVTQSSVTNGTGYFEFDSLIAGTYRISVSEAGFETLVREGMTLEAGATVKVPLQLKTGSANTTVTVTADVALLNTDDGSSG